MGTQSSCLCFSLSLTNKLLAFAGDDVVTVFYLFADITMFLFTLVKPLYDSHGQGSTLGT